MAFIYILSRSRFFGLHSFLLLNCSRCSFVKHKRRIEYSYTPFPIDLKNTAMRLISIQSLYFIVLNCCYFGWFSIVAAILFKNNLSSFRRFVSGIDGDDDGGSSSDSIWRLLNQYYLFAMLPIQLNLALIELPFEWLLRLVSCSFTALSTHTVRTGLWWIENDSNWYVSMRGEGTGSGIRSVDTCAYVDSNVKIWKLVSPYDFISFLSTFLAFSNAFVEPLGSFVPKLIHPIFTLNFFTLFKKRFMTEKLNFSREREREREKEIYWRFLNSSDQLLSIYYLIRIRFLFLKCIEFRNGMAHQYPARKKNERMRVNKTEHPKRKIFEYNKLHVYTYGEWAWMYSDPHAVRIG